MISPRCRVRGGALTCSQIEPTLITDWKMVSRRSETVALVMLDETRTLYYLDVGDLEKGEEKWSTTRADVIKCLVRKSNRPPSRRNVNDSWRNTARNAAGTPSNLAMSKPWKSANRTGGRTQGKARPSDSPPEMSGGPIHLGGRERSVCGLTRRCQAPKHAA